MIPNRELLEMLWSVINEDPAALALRADAAKKKDKYWRSDEWRYVKDMEVCLKSIKKVMVMEKIFPPESICELIFSAVGEEEFMKNQGL